MSSEHHTPSSNHAQAPAAASANLETREIDLTLPLSILIAGLIVGGSVIYGARTITRELQTSLPKISVAATDGARGGSGNQPAQQPPTQAPANQPDAPDPNKRYEVATGGYQVLGKQEAKVTIVEFTDLQCPFCKRFHDDAFAQIKKEYVDTGKVKVYLRHFPLPMHPDAPKAGEAIACANDQGKVWELTNAIYADQNNLKVDDLKAKAKTLGMNTATFNSCLDSGQKKTDVDRDSQEGSAAGVTGTPTMFVNGKMIVGAVPFTQFKTMIDQELDS